ncbi:MAG TPA: signal peptidase II [bacterium]|nr:signal peptidase II [bacterium]
MLVADQATKLVVEARLPLGISIPVIPGLLAFTHVHNRGIAFSLLGGIPLLVPVAIALTLLFLLFYNKARWSRRPVAQAALAMLGGGAIGNLVDRVRVGAVVDFIDVHVWPVFNLADIAVTAGAGLLILLLIRGDR